MYLYMQFIFSDTGVNRYVSLKTESIKTEPYKVKINICAHYFKVTFDFQNNTISKYNSIIHNNTTTDNLDILKGFSCNKGNCDEQ